MYWWQTGNFRRAAQNICGTSMLIDKIKNNGVASKHADGAWRCNIYIRNSRASPREYRILQTNFKNDDGQKLLISRPLKQKIVMFNFSTSRTFKKVLFSISFKRFFISCMRMKNNLWGMCFFCYFLMLTAYNMTAPWGLTTGALMSTGDRYPYWHNFTYHTGLQELNTSRLQVKPRCITLLMRHGGWLLAFVSIINN